MMSKKIEVKLSRILITKEWCTPKQGLIKWLMLTTSRSILTKENVKIKSSAIPAAPYCV